MGDRQLSENYSILKKKFKNTSMCTLIRNGTIKLIKWVLPFDSSLLYISCKYNSTVVLLFEIMRYWFILSIVFIIIFVYLLVFHLFGNLSSNGTCKYNLPCFLFYSSFTESEAKSFSITYGVWWFFFGFASFLFYFILQSKEESLTVYKQLNKNTKLSSYVFNSWDFNIKSNDISLQEKENIVKNSKWYWVDYHRRYYEKQRCCSCNEWLLRIISVILYIVVLMVFAVTIWISYYVKKIIRGNIEGTTTLTMSDILSDVFIYIIIPLLLLWFPMTVEVITKMELIKTVQNINLSNSLKRAISALFGISIIILAEIIYVIKGKNFIFKDVSTFVCPGLFNNVIALTPGENYTDIKTSYYSQCREEEVGITWLFIAIGYVLVYFFKEMFYFLFKGIMCKNKKKIGFDPIETLWHFYTVLLWFIIVIPFIPYVIVLIPIIILIEFKYQFHKLINKSTTNSGTLTAIIRNNNRLWWYIFMLLNWACLVMLGYFYLDNLPHTEKNKCLNSETSGTVSLLVSGTLCGPIQSNTSFSALMTSAVLDNIIFGWLYRIFMDFTILIIIIWALVCALIFKEVDPKEEYFDFIWNRQRLWLRKFKNVFIHLKKRDVISSMLIKLTKKKKI